MADVWDRYSEEAAFFNRSERRLDFVYDHIRRILRKFAELTVSADGKFS